MKHLTPLAICFLVLFTGTATAQYFGAGYSFYQAHGDLDQNIDHSPMGPSMNFLFDLGKDRQWTVGGEGGIAMYSKKEYTIIDQMGRSVDMYEEDCFFNAHILGQYNAFRTNNVVIYGEARTGITAFFSESHAINDDYEGEDDDDFCNMDMHGAAFNLGLGAGIRLNLSGIFRGDGAVHDRIWFTSALSTNTGTRTSYRQAGEGVTDLNEGTSRSLTNYSHLRFGLSIKICGGTCPLTGGAAAE